LKSISQRERENERVIVIHFCVVKLKRNFSSFFNFHFHLRGSPDVLELVVNSSYCCDRFLFSFRVPGLVKWLTCYYGITCRWKRNSKWWRKTCYLSCTLILHFCVAKKHFLHRTFLLFIVI
jgi:hypothetical protein